MSNIPIGNALDLAVIRRVSKTYVECNFVGRTGEKGFQCPIPQPYASKGGGFLAGIERGTVVLVATGPSERKFILAVVPLRRYYFDQDGISDSHYTATPFPDLEEGELMIKSSTSGSYVNILSDGNILLDGGIGDSEADFELSPFSKTMFARVDNKYTFTEAGRSIEGVIKRDKHAEENNSDTATFDFLAGDRFEILLEEIGRSPEDEVQTRTTTVGRNFIRNPALVEKRNIVYEYANSYGVQNISAETNAMISTERMEGSENLIGPVGARNERRTDVLNLNMYNHNHLMERVEGTLVDIYGNVLDINRNKISIPNLEFLATDENDESKDVEKSDLLKIYRYMRRSIKYHFEINSRKEISEDEPNRDQNIDQREHSRWSVDVDGEGLTKINIPASSNTGNIPVLGRYITSIPESDDERDSGSYRDENAIDIKLSPFGANGPTISNSGYKPEAFDGGSVTAGTAYHNLMKVASILFESGKWGKRANGTGTPTNRISSPIRNKIDDDDANAGGRSMHANLDGSVEVSIGADSIDNKSLLLDLEGGIVSHYGADTNGRSITHQSDGTVLIQIGDKSGNPGRLEIHLANGPKSQKIIIDETGMTIDVSGNMVLNASGNIGISAGANLLLNGSIVSVYGTVDASPEGLRTVGTGGTVITPSGMPHIGMFG